MADYNKRPLWQWIVIYLIIGTIVYGVIYSLFFNKGYSHGKPYDSNQQMQKSNSIY